MHLIDKGNGNNQLSICLSISRMSNRATAQWFSALGKTRHSCLFSPLYIVYYSFTILVFLYGQFMVEMEPKGVVCSIFYEITFQRCSIDKLLGYIANQWCLQDCRALNAVFTIE